MPKRHDRNTSNWASLPAEIRLLILEEILRQRHRGWALGAAVCKEWQSIIEPNNFRQLALQIPCLDELEKLDVRLRPFVKHISLNIELLRYACPTCESGAMSNRDYTIFGNAITRLFYILSTWEPAGQLTLELSASSPSDSQHSFKNYCFGPGHEDTGDWTEQERATRWHDPKHGWVHGQQIRAPDPNSLSAMYRLFTPFHWKVPNDLPEVHAVTSFLIRRQVRHEILPEVLEALWKKLPRLESIVYEMWRVHTHEVQHKCAKELAELLQHTIPNHVKKVSIFQDFNAQTPLLQRFLRHFYFLRVEDVPDVNAALAEAFATKSRYLEHLSISFMIDAERFFAAYQRRPRSWTLLRSLALTSPTLARTAPRQDIYTLLQNAGSTALDIPQLKSMVLWNTEPGQACAFTYQRPAADGVATLTWRSTWDVELSNDVVESWKKVVSGSCSLRFEKEAIEDVDIRSHGDAIHCLRLPDGVIDPGSLKQIRQEGMM